MLVQRLQQPVIQRSTAAVLVAYGGCLAWLSLTPVPAGVTVSDKLLHVGAYGLFMMLAAPVALVSALRTLGLLAGAIVLYSASLEVAQAFVPGRYPSGLDLLANAVGVALAVIVLLALRRSFVAGARPPVPGP